MQKAFKARKREKSSATLGSRAGPVFWDNLTACRLGFGGIILGLVFRV